MLERIHQAVPLREVGRGHGPAGPRKVRGDKLSYIEEYLLRDCGAKGL